MKTVKLKLPKKERIKVMNEDYNMEALLEISVVLTIAVLAMVFISTY